MPNKLPQLHPCAFIPPHVLVTIAENGTAEERNAALATLSLDQSIRAERRILEATRSVARATAGAGGPHKKRGTYSANNATNLPGTLKRSEGDASVGDVAVDEGHDGLGATFDLFWNVFGRDSIDGSGMNLTATVHYGNKYNNAFWNGNQMVFGDGDGTIFNRFTIAIDVEGHELTHGVTGATAGLEYHDQPGALNESMSDCFGSMVKQRSKGHSSDQADWLIGEGLLAAGINGVALRSMKAPGTAYDDPKIGKDPQPDHMSKYVNTSSDNGGVHINSGIPNKAFYLVSIGLGGNSWERAGKIWYVTLTDSSLSSTASFLDFATLTATHANTLFGSGARDVVVQAWHDVGLDIANMPTWQYSKLVLSTFTSPHSANAWAYIEDLGWRQVQALTADGVTNAFASLTEAQASGQRVHVYADGSLTYQTYSA
jgi:Zn-dependent metalloprotease